MKKINNITICRHKYTKREDFENDLFFSTYMCNSVVNYILDCILENTIKSYSLQICS